MSFSLQVFEILEQNLDEWFWIFVPIAYKPPTKTQSLMDYYLIELPRGPVQLSEYIPTDDHIGDPYWWNQSVIICFFVAFNRIIWSICQCFNLSPSHQLIFRTFTGIIWLAQVFYVDQSYNSHWAEPNY